MIQSCFNFILSVIVSIFNGILTVITSLEYASIYFESYFELLLILDFKRMVLLLLLVVLLWQLWKMRQRLLAFKKEWKRQHQTSDSNLGFSGTSWKSGNFEGMQPNSSRVSSLESGDFNRILDFMLRELCNRCRGNISVGPLNFTDKVPLLQTDWLFEAHDCDIKYLDTAHRVGCATTRDEPGGVLVLDATVALHKLRVSIIKYFARVLFWRVSGTFVGTVESLALRIEVALTTPFAAELRSLSLTNMGPPRVYITGLGFCTMMLWNWMQSSLLSRKRLENFIKPIFERELKDLAIRVSAIRTPRKEEKCLPRDEFILSSRIEAQSKIREDTIIQTIKFGTRQIESRPWETASSIPRYRTEVFPQEAITIRTIREYENNYRDTRQMRLADADATAADCRSNSNR